MLPDFVQQFKNKRQVVEAVQLTADADWEAIAAWCGGEYGEARWIGVHSAAAYESDWLVRFGELTSSVDVLADEDFRDEFQPVPVAEGLVGEIRRALASRPEGGQRMSVARITWDTTDAAYMAIRDAAAAIGVEAIRRSTQIAIRRLCPGERPYTWGAVLEPGATFAVFDGDAVIGAASPPPPPHNEEGPTR